MMDTWPKAGAQTMFMKKKKKRYKLFEKMFEKKGALDGWQGMCSRSQPKICWEDILNREVGERVCPPRTMHRVFKGAWPTTPLARMYLPGVCGDLKR